MVRRPTTTSEELSIALIKQQLEYMIRSIDDVRNTMKTLDAKMDNQFVTKIEFAPIKNIVYALVGLVLTAVATGLLALVIK